MMLSWKSPGATSRLPLQWSQWPPTEPAVPSTFLALQGPTPCPAASCRQLGTCHSQSSVLEGPQLARNCSLYFVEYFIIFFFPLLPSWDCDPRPPLVIGAGPGILAGSLQSRLVPKSSDQTTLVALLGAGWGLRES